MMYENENDSFQGGDFSAEAEEGKKTGKKKPNQRKTTDGNKKFIFAMVALVSAIVIFVVLTVIQNNIIKNEEKVSVVVAIKDVPAGLVLNQESIQQYFTMELRPAKDVPAGHFTSGHALVDKITARDISAREVATPNCVITEDIYADMEDPVLISVDVDKLSHAVGGTLRAGDFIDIKVVVDMQNLLNSMLSGVEDGEYSLEDVPSYVEEGVYPNRTDGDGNFIDADNGEVTGGVSTSSMDLATRLAKSIFHSEDFVYSATGNYACVPVASNVRVVDVFNQAGQNTVAAEADGTKQVATVFTIVVEREMEDMIYLAMEEGTMEISKVIYPDGKEKTEEENITIVPEGSEAVVGGGSGVSVENKEPGVDTADQTPAQ